jgi:alkaline phosphatase
MGAGAGEGRRVLSFLLAAGLLAICICNNSWAAGLPRGESLGAVAAREPSRAKNIIFMVADGMGLGDVTAARILKHGLSGPLLHLELGRVGYTRTYAANGVLTDSAAAASAWACGEKFNRGEICMHRDGRGHKASILEIAAKKGKSTGLVATSTITDGTPAAFGAHVLNRACENEVARQYIAETGVDVLLGGGRSRFSGIPPDLCGTNGDFIAEAVKRGYRIVYTKEEMEAAVAAQGAGSVRGIKNVKKARSVKRLLGLFADEGLTPEKDRTKETTEPTLSEMAEAALTVLEKDADGFFLMVEGSQIDWGKHQNDADYLLTEILAFDEAVKTVLGWIGRTAERRRRTLLIVVSDHETGGFAIKGPGDSVVGARTKVDSGWVTRGHTGTDVVIWSQGPGSHLLSRPGIENSSVYDVMTGVLK